MNLLGMLVLISGPLLGIAWLILEFKGNRFWRITCGLFSLILLTASASLATTIIDRLDYNAWYGFATKELIDETIRGIEAGKSEMVLQELKTFQAEYQPTYENRAKYVTIAGQTADRLKKANPQPDASDGVPGVPK